MFITMVGTSYYASEQPPIENAEYSLRFEVDHASVESGTYLYGIEQQMARSVHGSEVGLSEFHELKLRLKLREGGFRTCCIDLHQAMRELMDSQAGQELECIEGEHSIALVVGVSAEQVSLEYHLHRDIKGPEGQFYFKTQIFQMKSVQLSANV